MVATLASALLLHAEGYTETTSRFVYSAGIFVLCLVPIVSLDNVLSESNFNTVHTKQFRRRTLSRIDFPKSEDYRLSQIFYLHVCSVFHSVTEYTVGCAVTQYEFSQPTLQTPSCKLFSTISRELSNTAPSPPPIGPATAMRYFSGQHG